MCHWPTSHHVLAEKTSVPTSQPYLHDIRGLVDVLLEDHHGRSVDVDVVLAGQLLGASEPDVHVTKGQVISVRKGGQLDGKKAPAHVYIREPIMFFPPSAHVNVASRAPPAV